jgi:hypothetical protein
MPKTKLTLSISKDTLDAAKLVADQKHIPLSRLIENFLGFFSKPYVYCFKCGERFGVDKAKVCAKCGWLICPECKVCGCGLNEETSIGIFHMRKVYEDLLAGRVKQS